MQRTLAFQSYCVLIALVLFGGLALSAQVTNSLPLPRPQGLISPTDTGGYFGISFGHTMWGEESTCSCNAPNLVVSAGYETLNGLGFGVQSLLTATVNSLIVTNATVSYFPSLGRKKPSRLLGVAGGIGLPFTLTENWFTGRHNGRSQFYELRLRTSLGQRKNTRVQIGIGVTTLAERYREDGFFDGRPRTTRLKHSGIHLRMGVVW